ncbi:MAG: hypothetical protein JXR88_16885 [Clostridia bacterium]|nr:hypothetical protein [Clostridia bacterium]
MKTVIINQDASQSIQNYFKSKGYDLYLFSGTKAYPSVQNHPDLYLFYDGELFVEPSVDLKGIVCSPIGDAYPENVKYNVAKVGSYIICHPKYVDEDLLHHLKKHYTIIPVKQGYSKCSTLIIDDRSIITSDQGIYKAVKAHDLDALLISPGFIELKGMNYGFIGGAGIRMEEAIFFCGDITKHPDYKKIKNFIENRHLKIDYTKEPLTDLGSLFIIESVRK